MIQFRIVFTPAVVIVCKWTHILMSKCCVVYVKSSHNFFMLAWPKTWRAADRSADAFWDLSCLFRSSYHEIWLFQTAKYFLVFWFLCVCRSQEDVRSGAAGEGSVDGTGSAPAVQTTWRNTCSWGRNSLRWSVLYWKACVRLNSSSAGVKGTRSLQRNVSLYIETFTSVATC